VGVDVGRLARSAAWTLLSVRVAYWLGAALALLWAPLHGRALTPFRAYGPLSDLLFGTFAQWDSVWFLHVAEHGYDSEQVTAFFPLYPAVVHVVAVVTRSMLVAGVLVSLASAGAAAVLLARIARPLLGSEGAAETVLYVALYPLAFVFCAVYSDGLFLALAAAAFLAALRDRPWLAGILGGLAVGTRLVGLALLPALLVLLWPRSRSPRELLRPLPLALLPGALGLYALYLRAHLGNAGAFLDAQGVYWHRQRPPLGPIAGLWRATSAAWHGALELLRHLPRAGDYPGGFAWREHVAAWNVLHFVLLLAALWLTWVAWRRLGAAFGAYSLATIAIVLSAPAQFFPLVSLPRFLLGDFPLFLALASHARTRPRARVVLLCGFAAVGAVAAVAFSRKVWVA
jgi:hypothetical protein